MDRKQRSVPRLAAIGAVVLGLAVGSYGIASAATGSGSSSSSGTATTTTPTQTAPAPGGPGGGGTPWGAQHSDETLLTGDALTKVTDIAKAKVPGGTVVRVETDADGNAMYEAHMTEADGTPVTVYVNAQFEFVSLETR